MYNQIVRDRIENLRKTMRLEGVDYYLIVTDDYHSSEYVCDHFKCREYISGFTGSNGDLLVWNDGAALWTDGRYFLQAEKQLEGTGISLMKMGEKDVPTVSEFLVKNMLPGQVLGFDGKTVRIGRAKELENTVKEVSKKACADAENPNDSYIRWDLDLVGKIWDDRPGLPNDKAYLISEKLTGETRAERLEKVRRKMHDKNASVMLLSSLDDIAYILLLRGNDIEYNPVVLSYMLLYMDKAFLYAEITKFSEDVLDELKKDGVIVRPYQDIINDLREIDITKVSLWYDENRSTYALYKSLTEKETLINETLPTVLMKAIKTKEEIENEKLAHVKDAVAVTKFLYELSKLRDDEEFKSGNRKVTEIELAQRLFNLRREQEDFIEESFAPIIATGANGAIIHYEPTPEDNKVIEKDAFLLMDTGAQFLQGTTDITRTVCMGEPTAEMKKHFTAVLRGHLNLMAAVFPEGTTGPNLDILARKPLWEMGLDYRHGTGHGVGFLLNVHEGPQNINQKGIRGRLGTAFEPGMITSDEPGVYLPGKYGIRTENMIVCDDAYETEYGKYYKFSSLTLVPYDKRSIDFSLMKKDEIDTLNEYNKRVRETIMPHLSNEEQMWLSEELKLEE